MSQAATQIPALTTDIHETEVPTAFDLESITIVAKRSIPYATIF